MSLNDMRKKLYLDQPICFDLALVFDPSTDASALDDFTIPYVTLSLPGDYITGGVGSVLKSSPMDWKKTGPGPDLTGKDRTFGCGSLEFSNATGCSCIK